MLKKELVERSPLRILENSTHGGVQKGDIGVIVARKGVGKTACLVHIATDQLFQDKHVIHVSFSRKTDHIVSWYEDIFGEIAKRCNLDNVMEIHDELVRNRIIMNFIQDGIHVKEIEKSILTLINQGHFSADVIIIDGYDFSKSSKEELEEFKKFAKELNLGLWFSASLDGHIGDEFDGSSMPETLTGLVDQLSIVISLQPKDDYIHINMLKDHDNVTAKDLHLKLDSEILLIARDK